MAANFVSSQSSEGLHTLTVNIPEAGQYNFNAKFTLTRQDGSASQGPGGGAGTGSGAPPAISSQVVVTVNQNGSPIFTSQAGVSGFQLNAVQCAANDVMTFVTSSALAQDKQLNAVRMVLAVSEGPL